MTDQIKCKCGNPMLYICANCEKNICDDINCSTDTVDGYLCGTYTEKGCARKYTTCEICIDDKAIHESDLIFCEDCNKGQCEDCAKDYTCNKCENNYCEDCYNDHINSEDSECHIENKLQ